MSKATSKLMGEIKNLLPKRLLTMADIIKIEELLRGLVGRTRRSRR